MSINIPTATKLDGEIVNYLGRAVGRLVREQLGLIEGIVLKPSEFFQVPKEDCITKLAAYHYVNRPKLVFLIPFRVFHFIKDIIPIQIHIFLFKPQ